MPYAFTVTTFNETIPSRDAYKFKTKIKSRVIYRSVLLGCGPINKMGIFSRKNNLFVCLHIFFALNIFPS